RRQPQSQQAAALLDVDGPPPGPASALKFVAPPPPPSPPPPALMVSDSQLASASPPPKPRNPVERPASFWQVMGANDMPANSLVRLLKEKGFSATLVVPVQDNLVRVMVGPYSDAQSLDRAKAALETAGFQAIQTW